MPIEKTSTLFNALYPEELLERYSAGERNFLRSNLFRKELEHILGVTTDTSIITPAYTWLEKFNLLWADFHDPIHRRFEWDTYGAFIPIEYDDLLDTNLSGLDLSEINFQGSYLYRTNFSNTNLSHAVLRNTILLDVNFQGADLSHADLRDSIVTGNLQSVNLYMARLDHCTMNECNLQGANLKRAKLRKTSFAGADLRNADLSNAHFERTILNRAKLQGVDFKKVKLNNVYVTGIALTKSQQLEFLESLEVHLLDAKSESEKQKAG